MKKNNTMYEDICIPTYIINLKCRTDRLENVLQQFAGKAEFDIHVTEACTHKIGNKGLWQSIVKIVQEVENSDDDIIIICEDDHTFTKYYNRDMMIQNIIEAGSQGVELLSGGIGGFDNAVPITANRYWINWFWCTQFIILYRPIFQKIFNYEFKDTDTVDGVFSNLTTHKMVLYPFISIQHDFGYSDVTRSNNEISGKITEHFMMADQKLSMYQKVFLKYLK